MYLFDYHFVTSYDGDVSPGVLIAVLCCYLMIALVLYCIRAYAQYTMAKKLQDQSPLWAWVPILDVVQVFRMANMPTWYTILVFIPLANIAFLVLWIMAYYKIITKVGLPGWHIIPLILLNPFYLVYVAVTLGDDPLQTPSKSKEL